MPSQAKLIALILSGLVTLGTAIVCLTDVAQAQITPDSTLGQESSRITANAEERNAPATLIEGGATRGAHLFHSFSDFNVGNGQRVYFDNPAGVLNIFSRVTGNSGSNIFGTLGVDGMANLYLLNPNGIVFGPNARLDIAGSFTASTANGQMMLVADSVTVTPDGDQLVAPGCRQLRPVVSSENRSPQSETQFASVSATSIISVNP